MRHCYLELAQDCGGGVNSNSVFC